MNTQEKGQDAETLAKEYLQSKGYQFVAANFRTPLGEVDLVMQHKDTLIFVEVRSLKNPSLVQPFETITKSKQNKIIKTALSYIKSQRLHNLCLRFDVISITTDKITHIPDAFQAPAGRYTL